MSCHLDLDLGLGLGLCRLTCDSAPPFNSPETLRCPQPNRAGLAQVPRGDSGAHAVFVRTCLRATHRQIGMLAYNRFIGVTRLACPATWAAQTLATVQ